FSSIAASDRLDHATPIRWNPAHRVVEPGVDDVDRRVRVTDGRHGLRLPLSTVRALVLLAAGDDVVIDDLPDLDHPSRLVVARRLVADGICTIVG
ncbi:MAG: hypothetical protein ABIO83_10170, partial [Ilumatobacteraceae bacterium]